MVARIAAIAIGFGACFAMKRRVGRRPRSPRTDIQQYPDMS
jgi:hypothetical protein